MKPSQYRTNRIKQINGKEGSFTFAKRHLRRRRGELRRRRRERRRHRYTKSITEKEGFVSTERESSVTSNTSNEQITNTKQTIRTIRFII